MDRTSVTKPLELGSIPGLVKSNSSKNLQLPCLDVQHYTGQCKASTVRGRNVAA